MLIQKELHSPASGEMRKGVRGEKPTNGPTCLMKIESTLPRFCSHPRKRRGISGQQQTKSPWSQGKQKFSGFVSLLSKTKGGWEENLDSRVFKMNWFTWALRSIKNNGRNESGQGKCRTQAEEFAERKCDSRTFYEENINKEKEKKRSLESFFCPFRFSSSCHFSASSKMKSEKEEQKKFIFIFFVVNGFRRGKKVFPPFPRRRLFSQISYQPS